MNKNKYNTTLLFIAGILFILGIKAGFDSWLKTNSVWFGIGSASIGIMMGLILFLISRRKRNELEEN